jgi:hypothetical protein
MFEAEATEFPFVAELPKREKSKFSQVMEQIKALTAAQEKHGSLIPQTMAAALLQVSQQRVNQICQDGRLVVVDVGSQRLITEESLVAFCKLERKAGRPSGVKNTLEVAKAAIQAGKQVFRGRQTSGCNK